MEWANLPELNKAEIHGNGSLLPIRCDTERLRNELEQLPQELWGNTGGRVAVHHQAESVFLRGHAPAEGDLPIGDRPALDHLPYTRSILESLIPAPPLRALLARLRPLGQIGLHTDKSPTSNYFSISLRLHFPIITNDQVAMIFGGERFRMAPGEIWVVNNCVPHTVVNHHPAEPRTHLIADFLPTPELLEIIGRGNRHLREKMVSPVR